MTDDLVRQLRAFQRQAAELQAVLTKAQAAAQHGVTGTDRTGTVTVTLAADGIPETAQVAADWLRNLSSAGVADAVVEAAQRAATTRLERWAQAINSADASAPAEVAAVRPEIRTADRPRQSLDTVAERMHAALGQVDEIAAHSPLAAQGTGANVSGQLTVTVSHAGLLSCTAAPRWLAQQSGPALTRALNEALADARDDLRSTPAAAGDTVPLDDLFADALALLAKPSDIPIPRRHT